MAKATVVNTRDLSSDFQNWRKAWPDGVYHCYIELLCRDCQQTKDNHQMLACQIPTKNRDPVSDRTEQKLRTHIWGCPLTSIHAPWQRSVSLHTQMYTNWDTHTHMVHVYTKEINKNFKIQILWQVKSHHMDYHIYW